MTRLARSSPAEQAEQNLIPSLSPSPSLRRPTPVGGGRFLSNRVEREYATLADRLDALEHDIRGARRASRRAQRAPGHTRTGRPVPPPTPHGEPTVLADGARILIRPIEPADAPQLRAGFDRLDAASRYQRFLTPIGHLTQRQLDYLTRVDHEAHEALVAVDAATGDGVGIARFVRDGRDPTRADVAIAVADRWQGRGVGTLLAGRLAGRAQAVGVKSFTARMLTGNRAARRLVEQTGRRIREHDDGGAIVLSAEAQERSRRSRTAGRALRRSCEAREVGERESGMAVGYEAGALGPRAK
jgi:RimJ/RimL family protein N-acetyltransferase